MASCCCLPKSSLLRADCTHFALVVWAYGYCYYRPIFEQSWSLMVLSEDGTLRRLRQITAKTTRKYAVLLYYCCGDGVSLLLYQGACCLGLLVLKFKCTARPHIIYLYVTLQWMIRETGRPVQYSHWTACLRVSLIDLQIHARSIWCWSKNF